MEINEIKNGTNPTIRFATLNDVPEIETLNQKWLVPNIDTADKTNGFLFGDPLKTSDFKKIILAGELTVASLNNKIIGYYLFDNYSDTEVLRQYSTYISELISKGYIEQKIRISKRAQAVIEKDFQNNGLSKMLFPLLLTETKEKYDVLFSVVSKQNPKLIAHQKSGWSIISENEEVFFLQYKLAADSDERGY